MSFLDAEFLFFLTAVLIGAALLEGRARLILLTGASYLFYGWVEPAWTLLLAFSTIVDYLVGGRLAAAEGPARRRWLLVSLGSNLGILGWFKYAGFVSENIRAAAAAIGLDMPTPDLSVALPVGISFYTFQTLSYTIDIYRRQLAPSRSFLEFAFFVSFFPQLVAGPIVRAREFLFQIPRAEPLRRDDTVAGAELVLVGLFKKSVLGDRLAPWVDQVYGAPDAAGTLALWAGTVAFALQIYGDFSGYTDIARGIARMFGYTLPVNFDRPYLSVSPKEFWRRWHRTLSYFIRDYVFIPLGGSRGAFGRVVLNLLVTWFLCGLWHGAAWTFVLWGLFHGGLLVAHAMLTRVPTADRALAAIPRSARVLSTFGLVVLGWVPFRAQSLGETWTIWAGMLNWRPGPVDISPRALVVVGVFAVIHVLGARYGWDPHDRPLLARLSSPVRTLAIALALFALLLLAAEPAAFIYFQF